MPSPPGPRVPKKKLHVIYQRFSLKKIQWERETIVREEGNQNGKSNKCIQLYNMRKGKKKEKKGSSSK